MTIQLVAAAAALLLAAPASAAGGTFEKEVVIGAPISEGGLTVFPLRPRGTPDTSEYLVLDEAFATKVLTVHETDRQGSVGTLHVSNRSAKPIYAMAGELLLGGKQDRVIAQSIVIAPGAKRAPVPVYCVEHGRWQGRSASFESGKALGHKSLRQKAMFAGQSEVWDEVASTNESLKTRNESDTYRKAARKLEVDTAQATRRILAALDAAPGTTGLAVAVGGEVTAVETFAAPALFAKLREKLVASYVAESLRLGKAGPSRPVAEKDVVSFMERASRAPQKRTKEGASSRAVDFEDAGVSGEHVMDKGKPAPVQKSYFKN